MRKPLLIAVLALILAGTVAASSHSGVTVTDIEEAVNKYNENTDQLPGLVRSLIKDERINLNVSSAEGDIVYGFVLDGVTIVEHQEGGIPEPTLTITTSMETLEAISTHDNPRQRAVQAFKSGEISYETRGFWRGIKFGIVSTLIKIFA